MESVIDLKIQ